MNVKRTLNSFLKVYTDHSFILQQKAYVFLWSSLVMMMLLISIIIINATTSSSSHPFLINITNMMFLCSFCVGLYLLRNGHYDKAVLSGLYIKLEPMAKGGVNNNVFFIFPIIIFSAFFGKRGLLVFITSVMVIFIASFPFIMRYHYGTQNFNVYFGTLLNIEIAIIIVFALSMLLSKITEHALFLTNSELIRNRKLSCELEQKVQQLQKINIEMEHMNEEKEETAQEIIEKNKELKIFKEFADASTQGFCMFDLNGAITYMNQALMQIVLADNQERTCLHSIYSCFPDDYTGRFSSEIIPEIIRDHHWSGELPLMAENGHVIQTLQNIFVISDDYGEPLTYAMVVTDLTDMKKLEAQLIQAQKMEAIGRIAGGIAHDFNNYLTAITGYSSLMISRIDPDDSLAQDALEIIRAADSSAQLIRQLLTFSRGQLSRPVVLNINNEVLEIKNMLERVLGENIVIVTELYKKLNHVRMDPAQIEQVILNLAINARDAMPEGGVLIIKTENIMIRERDCHSVINSRPGSFVCLTVQDTGHGIDENTIGQIFEPFYTTKEIGKGSGLGLAVIFDIVKQHNGWINVDSKVGKKTVFRIYLPVVEEDISPKSGHKRPLDQLFGTGELILLVEDQEEVRRFASTALTKYGYSVLEAATAFEAIEIFNKQQGMVDLVFSDLILPDKSGLELITKIKDSKNDIAFLLCSGYTDKIEELEEILDKGYQFLPKPYTLYDLLYTVHVVISTMK